jgi:type IV pilus assembly protein PilP
MKRFIPAALLSLLAACTQQHEDLQGFVANAGAGMRGNIQPLPEVRPYEPFAYAAFDLPDPFRPRKVSGGGGANAPDMNRPREPLENYPLESMKLVGTLARGADLHALIRTPENAIYRVHKGNYLGQNHGRIVAITEADLTLREAIEDQSGDWAERMSVINLQE